MTIKIILIRAIIMLLLVWAVLILLISTAKMPNIQNNGFTRKVINQPLQTMRIQEIDPTLTRISGISNSTIYLSGNRPTAVMEMNKDFTIKDTLTINLSLSKNLAPSDIFVDSPFIYIHLNNHKAVISGSLSSKLLKFTKLNSEVFTKSIQISPYALLVRAFHQKSNGQVFQKIKTATGEIIKESAILESSDDFGFSTDGVFIFDSSYSSILYVQYFTNKFYCIDTNLNLKYTSHTIDTTFTAKVNIGKSDDNENVKLTPTTARISVNKTAFSNSNYLFVVSNLRSDNEKANIFSRNNAIDVYKIESGVYVGSFYIPKIGQKSLRSASVSGDTLFVLHEGKIAAYQIPEFLQSISKSSPK